MSVDGTGNTDRDDFYNLLAIWLQRIEQDIRHTFTFESEETLYNDEGESHIIGNVDILLTLCEHYDEMPVTIRDLSEVVHWKTEYLTTFDKTIHAYAQTPGYIEKRRSVIIETFDKLYELVKENFEY